MLFCTKCKQSFGGEDSELYTVLNPIPEPLASTRCPMCRVVGKLSWKVAKFRKVNAKFDGFFQCYRRHDGVPIPEETYGGDFPCPKCRAPSLETGVDCYREYYKCRDCEHSFSVK